MITLPQNTKNRATPAPAGHLRPQEAPPIAPAAKIVREIECDGEPPLEALRNSDMC